MSNCIVRGVYAESWLYLTAQCIACLKKAGAACTERKQLPEFLGKALMLKIIKRNLCSKWGSCFTGGQEIKQWKCQRGTWMGTPCAQGSWGNGIHGKTLNMGLSLKIFLPADLTGCKVYSLSLAGLVLLRGLGNPIVIEISCNSDFKHQQEVTEKDHSSCRMQHCILADCTSWWDKWYWGCLENTEG